MSGLRSRFWISGIYFMMPACAVALFLCVSLIAGAAPARAQFFGSWGFGRTQPPAQLAPQDIVQRLSRAGFRVLQLRANGSVFLADVTDRAGRPLRLVVNAVDGVILQRFATIAPRISGPEGGATAPQPGFAPSPSGSGDAAPSGMRPRSPVSRAKPSPSEATMAPPPIPSSATAPPPPPPPVVTAAPVAAAPPPAPVPIQPMVGPGFANGVPINPLD